MKKSILLIFCIVILLCGCSFDNSSTKHSKVTINMPEDDLVNGYRTEDNVNPDKIGWDDITLSDKVNTDNLYCGNKNSKKFHLKTCNSLKNTKAENKVFYRTKEQYIENGYTACQVCNP